MREVRDLMGMWRLFERAREADAVQPDGSVSIGTFSGPGVLLGFEADGTVITDPPGLFVPPKRDQH
jgi:hypothetical protein